ncbi:MAG: SpoIIE family protein phosphatase [Acidobacteriaceae bacterium]|nr:SpoIIE family protein phosphatase [Acidobacteriaceae bacterium]
MELLISQPEGDSKTVELKQDAISLGRSADNDLAYPDDPWLSRYHLRFERRAGAWFVRDCESRNGTMLNAKALREPKRLRSGDRLYAGNLTIEVQEKPAAEEVITFVPDARDQTRREATVVTSLDNVLRKTSEAGPQTKALIRAGQELASHRPLEEVFSVILNLALSAVQAERGVILTLEKSGLTLRASKGEGFTVSTAVRDRVLREKCSLMVTDAQLDSALREQKSILLHRVRSMMAAPLQTREQVIGLIYVDNGAVIRPFSQDDLDLLTVMANVAAIRIEHARLAEVEQAEKLMQIELAQASEIQQSLLPSEAPACSGYDVAGYNLPCQAVGGDYYDFLTYKDGRLGVVVGDVAGKGLPAAIMMSSLQARVQMLCETCPEPAYAVTILNRSLAERCPPGRFITFLYALLDPHTGRVEYCNAGHNYPIIIRSNGGTEQLRDGGLVLGIQESITYEPCETALASGDLLALYSDGVTEARRSNGEEFGESGLAEFLESRSTEPCADTVNALAQHVREWCAQPSFHDDFTVVLLRRL